LPYLTEKDIDSNRPFDMVKYYDVSKFHAFLLHYQTYRNKFTDFFASVGLPFDAGFEGLTSPNKQSLPDSPLVSGARIAI
jgi:hypothetical protein